jgi:hypothetical protein
MQQPENQCDMVIESERLRLHNLPIEDVANATLPGKHLTVSQEGPEMVG